MLISPTEPIPLRRLGRTSSSPEKYGVDYLMTGAEIGLVGVQRKEMDDLVASTLDGRLAREVIQMKELDWAIWVLEGRPQWSSEGQLLSTRTPYTLSRHLGLLFTLSYQGFSLIYTDTMGDTGNLLLSLQKWIRKEKHSGTNHRPNPRGMWGEADREEWQIHFLQGLPGLAYDRAAAIVRYYDGLPLQLLPGVSLTDVPGVGKVTAKKVEEVFRRGGGE